MAEPILTRSAFAPQMAENGKFVKLDMSGVTDYNSLSEQTSAYFTGERYAVLTYQVNSSSSTGVTSAVIVNNLPNTLWIASSSIPANVIYSPTIPNMLKKIEVQNLTTGSIYFIASTTNAQNTSAYGICIFSDTYYSLQTNLNTISVVAASAGNVRILGYTV